MSEKVRTLNLTSGNALTSPATTSTPSVGGGSAGGGGGCALIGAPTLISSTFSSSATQPLTPTILNANEMTISGAGGGGVGGSDTESQTEYITGGALTTQSNYHLLPTTTSTTSTEAGTNIAAVGQLGDTNSIMNSSQISTTSIDSMQLSSSNMYSSDAFTVSGAKPGGNGKHLTAHSVAGKSCRFPKLEDCAHFHYERVQLGPLSVRLVDDKSELLNSSIASQSIGGDIDSSQILTALGSAITGSITAPSSFRSFSVSNCWFIIKVFPHRCDPFLIKRSFDNMQMLDEMLHRCVYDRKISGLKKLHELEFKSEEDVEYAVAKYLERFSKIASDSLTCGTILTWLQLDNKGRRLPLADSDTMRSINTPAVGAAYGVRRYQAQASDEISIEVGDMISVIDMPSPAESIWWRGKKSHMQKSHYEVGFFPQACVATIGDKVPRNCPMPPPLVGQLDVSPTKPVLRKHGKLIAFFRSFILSRPSRRRLKQSGIYRERVFSCDLSEHLLNSGQEIPMVLKCCAEFIEEYGIIDGIYRLSGITSNIQKLRRAFDEERVPDLGNPEMKQDIHAVSSLLKMYFRELPNPLCTYQLYDNFVEAIQEKSESDERLRLMKETVLKLPPPHYRTLKYLSEHLNKISQHSARTGMTDKNLAIVWAPNLLRSPALESGGVAALRGVGVQAVVTEYLIRNCHHIFDALDDPNARLSYIATVGAAPAELRMDSLTDCESLLVEQREHDQLLSFNERPKSLGAGGPKLISLEEAQERHSRLDNFDIKQSMPISMVANNAANIGSYIEVGGGPSSLPDKYHTVLSMPRNWQKRKTHSWKSLFSRNQRTTANGSGANELKTGAGNSADDERPHKEGAQVTFAETDAIITSGGGKAMGKSLLKPEKTKSIELFETTRGDVNKPMDVCARSNSIDSLRTAGHSRSVSHDSYFDLLQSPQRGHMTTCPSRELSELGLNFDREEPEMRIFSESESLVSSPRVGKENIPPSSGATSRRILRARPEEFSSQTNSVNPSPKKQPRLNLLLSPSSAGSGGAHTWPQQQQHHQQPQQQQHPQQSTQCDQLHETCHEHVHQSSGDESCCKRYKLEDQLSDIQYIDCSTPEHQIANPQTLYTSVQVHAPPKSALSKNSLYSSTESANKLQSDVTACTSKAEPTYTRQVEGSSSVAAAVNARYSYPTVQLGAKRKEQECAKTMTGAFKERFSYPGSNAVQDRRYASKEQSKMHFEGEQFKGPAYGYNNVRKELEAAHAAGRNNLPYNVTPNKSTKQQPLSKITPEMLRAKNRNSYCNPNDQQQMNLLLLRSNSTDLCKEGKGDASTVIMERMKVSITPSSPVQSPRYSLLVGDTSSENSSAVTTPQYDLEPLMVTSAMSGLSGLSGTSSNQQQPLLLGVDAASSSYLGTSHESLGSNFTSHSHMHSEKRDMHALKRELSLDLQPLHSSRSLVIDQLDASCALPTTATTTTTASTAKHQQQQSTLPSPNNSNFTDNTSQSVTPSEFGYQHLQRQSSMHSLLDGTQDNSPTYEDYENTPSNLASPKMPLLGSPIKATISITYNLRSPSTKEPTATTIPQKTLLETSFDEHTVYEQVKFFRNSVTEVNQLLDVMTDGSKAKLENLTEEEIPVEQTQNKQKMPLEADIQMQNLIEDIEEQSSDENEKLLYENVQLRVPHSVYENMRGEDMKQNTSTVEVPAQAVTPEVPEKFELDSLDSIQAANEPSARKSPSNFSVKELANKFECSPVEQTSHFDFNIQRSSLRKTTGSTGSNGADLKTHSQCNLHTNEMTVAPPPSPPTTASTTRISPTPQQQQQLQQPSETPTVNSLKLKLHKSQQQFTRSLDENAFVREFGAKHLQDLAARSIQQLPELTEVCNNRRKSCDFTRPKTLNPPKRLPGMPISEEHCLRENNGSGELNRNSTVIAELDYESTELRITPTTENRISLIQHNNVAVGNCGQNSNTNANANVNANTNSNLNSHADLSNSNLNLSNTSLKVLSGVKLDRERIDKIKEERRQQLTQKYRGDLSYKSKSKTELNCGNATGGAGDVGVKEATTDSLRVKSKSRSDVRCLLKDMDNLQSTFARNGSTNNCSGNMLSGSESTLNAVTGGGFYGVAGGTATQRVRSISDEQNQNCEIPTTTITNVSTATTKTITTNKHHRELPTNATTTPAAIATEPEEYSARATLQKFESKCLDFANGTTTTATTASGNNKQHTTASAAAGLATVGSGARRLNDTSGLLSASRHSLTSTREKISPQFSIRDVTAMFESRSQNPQ